MLALGQKLDLDIVDLSRGGAGVARHEGGTVVFVPETAPGDTVCVEIIGLEKRYAQAKLLQVLKPSSQRVDPRCAVFGRCGGCQWQHIGYPLQWKTKVAGVHHALERVGLGESLPLQDRWDLLPARQVWNYRNRIQLRGTSGSVGFHARGSRDLVVIDRCEIALEKINESLPAVREEAQCLKRPHYKVELEVVPEGWVRRTWNSPHAAAGFRQVHDAQNALLQKWVFSQVPDQARVWDLFGGHGNLSLGLLRRVQSVDCVDVGAPGNLTDFAEPGIVRFHRSPVAPWVEHQAAHPAEVQRASPLVAISDPPREGLAADFNRIMGAAERAGVERWIAIGCDVDSWSRDLSKMVKRRWRIERLGVIDLFPQTPHVECLAVLAL